jgi:hypothetical protein
MHALHATGAGAGAVGCGGIGAGAAFAPIQLARPAVGPGTVAEGWKVCRNM